jgi:hypothetical protein
MEGLESIFVLLIVVVVGVLIAGYVAGFLSPSSKGG